jgi:hypothetical protein
MEKFLEKTYSYFIEISVWKAGSFMSDLMI